MLTTFSGRKGDFPAYKNKYLTLAQQSSSLCTFNHGLLGFLLTPAEYLTLIFPAGHVPAPFVPIPHPGIEPVLAVDANALAVSRHNAEWSSWKFHYEQHQLQQNQLQTFKVNFLNSLDKTSLTRITDQIHGTRRVTVAAIHTFLINRYGTMVSVDLISLAQTLGAPYQTTSTIEDLLQLHRDSHELAAAQLQPFPEYQKVHLLRASVKPCGIFEPCILGWLLTHSTVATQTFDSLATAITDFNDNFDRTATAASMGYSAAVTLPLSTPSRLEELIAAAVSAAFLAHTPSVTTSAPSAMVKLKYCWTHGSNKSHSSLDCQHRKNGHKERATAANKMGGST